MKGDTRSLDYISHELLSISWLPRGHSEWTLGSHWYLVKSLVYFLIGSHVHWLEGELWFLAHFFLVTGGKEETKATNAESRLVGGGP